MTDRDAASEGQQGAHDGPRARHDPDPRPGAWPRRPGERYQPRTRLSQALGVARRGLEQAMSGEGAAPREAPEGNGGRRQPETAPMFSTSEAALREPTPPASTPPASAPPTTSAAPTSEAEPPPALAAPAPTSFGPDPFAVPTTATYESTAAAPATAPVATEARPAPATAGAEEEPFHLVVDLRPGRSALPGPAPAGVADFGLGTRWGIRWREAAQGWVDEGDGRPMWRPVVATTDQLTKWEVDTYLGVVTAEVAVEAHGGDFQQLGATLARGREIGVKGLVEEAIERGGHAVVGVTMSYTPIGGRLLITITGTAVTLREPTR